MSWNSLDTRDRKLLSVILVCALLLIVIVAVFGPSQDEQIRIPSSFSNGSHGARAAYLLLQQSGYRVTRSTDSLTSVARTADEHTTVILAEPFYSNVENERGAVRDILRHGGRILATGLTGAMLVPGSHAAPYAFSSQDACNAVPAGSSAIASSGPIHIAPQAFWTKNDPKQRTAYLCDGKPVVVAYPSGNGQVIWWADSLPLENGSIADDGDLALLLNSIGPRSTTRVIWDESLHGASPSLWSYTAGTVLPWLGWQAALVGLLLVFSFSRRSGPLRPDPIVSRASPLEFARSLGSLYRRAGAANVAVTVSYSGFRLALEKATGTAMSASPEEAAAAISRWHGAPALDLEHNLVLAAHAADQQPMSEKAALAVVQNLQAAERALR